jgi:hypothetical protein
MTGLSGTALRDDGALRDDRARRNGSGFGDRTARAGFGTGAKKAPERLARRADHWRSKKSYFEGAFVGSILVSVDFVVLVEDFFLPFLTVFFFLVVVVLPGSLEVEVVSVLVVWVPVTGFLEVLVFVSVADFVSVV